MTTAKIFVSRATILIVVLSVTALSCSRIERQKFEGTYRAGQALESATATGVSYLDFQAPLRELGTEVRLLSNIVATKEEAVLAKMYVAAYEAYSDSASLWDLKNRWPKVDSGVLAEIQIRYMLPDDWKETGVQRIWTVASRRLTSANSAYLGRKDVSVAADEVFADYHTARPDLDISDSAALAKETARMELRVKLLKRSHP